MKKSLKALRPMQLNDEISICDQITSAIPMLNRVFLQTRWVS